MRQIKQQGQSNMYEKSTTKDPFDPGFRKNLKDQFSTIAFPLHH